MKLAHELAPLGDDDPTIPMAEAITEANRLLTLPAHERLTLPAPGASSELKKEEATMMTTSPPGRIAIAHEEGTLLHWYRDQAGIETGGTGHVRRPGDPDVITRAIADAWLANDLRVAESAVRAHSPDTITQAQFDACVSLAFNIGGGAFARSSVASLMSTGDWHGAANAFLLWDKIAVNGKLEPSQALAARRMREREMFLRDVPALDVG